MLALLAQLVERDALDPPIDDRELGVVDVDDLGHRQRAMEEGERRQLGVEPVAAAGVVLDAEALARVARHLVDRVGQPTVDHLDARDRSADDLGQLLAAHLEERKHPDVGDGGIETHETSVPYRA